MKKFPICIVGSVAYDIIMRFPGKFSEQILKEDISKINTCFVVDNREIHFGGTAANLALGFKKLDTNSLILSKVGEDIEDYEKYLKENDIEISGLERVKGEKTLWVSIVTDKTDNQITVVHPGAFGQMDQISLREKNLKQMGVELIVINPLIGKTSFEIAQQCVSLKIPYVFDPGQNIQTISKEDLIYCAKNSDYLMVNEYEFSIFKKTTGLNDQDVIRNSKCIIVTKGADGSDIYKNGEVIHVPVVKPKEIIDPTGAGDSYRAGFLTGILNKYSLETCGKMGALAGTYCIEEAGPQNTKYNLDEFKSRYEEVWKEKMK